MEELGFDEEKRKIVEQAVGAVCRRSRNQWR